MSQLSNLLQGKKKIVEASYEEDNLESGVMTWSFSSLYNQNPGCARFYGCALFDAQGFNDCILAELDVEVWAPGGRGSGCQCCCGGGYAGNPGTYARYTMDMTKYGFIWTQGMFSCVNGGSSTYCGQNSCYNYSSCVMNCTGCIPGQCTYSCFCICAEGGKSGNSHCINGGSLLCCFEASGWGSTEKNVHWNPNCTGVGDGCGWLKNWCSGDRCGCVNIGSNAVSDNTVSPDDKHWVKPQSNYSHVRNICWMPSGEWNASRVWIGACNPCCWPCMRIQMWTPPRRYAQEGAWFDMNMNFVVDQYSYDGDHALNLRMAEQGASTQSSRSGFETMCWYIWKCACYEETGCQTHSGIGVGGTAGWPCASVRNHGTNGGNGAVRITYKGNYRQL